MQACCRKACERGNQKHTVKSSELLSLTVLLELKSAVLLPARALPGASSMTAARCQLAPLPLVGERSLVQVTRNNPP